MERDALWWTEMMRGYGIGQGDHVLVSSSAWHCPWIDPIRSATTKVGAVHSNVEAWPWDAPRMAAFLRRFPITMLVGLTPESLAALEGMGDLGDILAGVKHILAHPVAAERLRVAGFSAGVLAMVGPVLALTPPSGEGVVVNDKEWLVEDVDGELVVSSGRARSARLDRQRTGIRGRAKLIDRAIRLELES